MKKIIPILLLAILFISCDDNYSYPEELTTKQVFTFHVNSSDWVEHVDNQGLNRYYSCNFKINGPDAYFISKGAAMAYVDYSGYQQGLPYTRHFENTAGDRWTTTIDYDYSATDVNFYVTSSDFAVARPEEMYFRLVLIL
mgnify:CR=1 FL=1